LSTLGEASHRYVESLAAFAGGELRLENASEAYTRATYEANRWRIIRNNAICTAVDADVRSRRIQALTGLSRQQIVNISARGPQPVPPEWEGNPND
jgi:hypothetical protein